jgi:hypothetical protein
VAPSPGPGTARAGVYGFIRKAVPDGSRKTVAIVGSRSSSISSLAVAWLRSLVAVILSPGALSLLTCEFFPHTIAEVANCCEF